MGTKWLGSARGTPLLLQGESWAFGSRPCCWWGSGCGGPSWEEGSRERGQDTPLGSGGIRSCGEKTSCGSGPCATAAVSWKAKAILGKQIGKGKGLRRARVCKTDI